MIKIEGLIERLERMEREWQEEKNLINSNPAVKASYEHYQQMVKLAKEYPNPAVKASYEQYQQMVKLAKEYPNVA